MNKFNDWILDLILIFVYRPLVWIAFHILWLSTRLLAPQSKLGRTLNARKDLTPPPPRQQKSKMRILVHCASGEFEYARPVIRELKQQSPETEIFVSYFSETYKGVIAKDTNVSWSGPLPFHSITQIRAWLSRIQPEQILIARTDVWPDFAREARRQKIPTVLFSASFPRLWNPLTFWTKLRAYFRLRHLTQAFVVQKQDVEVLQSIGLKASVGGDTRYDQVLNRLNNPKSLPAALQKRLPNNPEKIMVMGSTWQEDEQTLSHFIVSAVKDKDFTILIAPHEPSEAHLSSLESLLKNENVKVGRLSQWELAEAQAPQVLLIDRVGILAELYTLGRWAFVGGSFRKTVHSVMEPLAAGARTLVGPLHRNNAEAIEFQAPEINAVYCVGSSAEASEALSRIWPSPTSIQNQVKRRSGATQKLVDKLLSFG